MSRAYLPPTTTVLTEDEAWRGNETELGRALKDAGSDTRQQIKRDFDRAASDGQEGRRG